LTRVREKLSSSPFPADKARRYLPVAAGIVLAAVSLHLAGSRVDALKNRIEASTAPTEVVVASAPIRPGETFQVENLAKARLPASGVGRRNVPASEFQLLLGARSRDGMEAGDPVLWSDVDDPMDPTPLSEAVPEGRRAVTLPLDPVSSFAGMLRPGDRVDLLCNRDGDGAATVVLESVPVLAVDRKLDPSPGEEGASGGEPGTATLSLAPGESKALLRAARSGSVQWMLRNGNDNLLSPPMPWRVPPIRTEIIEGGVLCDRRERP
jgi:pilus assembly protein CpaB